MTQDDYLGQDPAAMSSSEDLDEDELRVDPLERGVEPPEHWSAADKHGTTAREMAEGEPHEQRFAAEQPEVQPPVGDTGGPGGTDTADGGPTRRTEPDDLPEAARRGQSADGV